MSAPTVRRFEGISFVNQPPQATEKRPRMDIAVFVGYTSARPLNEQVMVEDAAQFEAIFGNDLPLAWYDGKAELVNYGYTKRSSLR
jgi:hypothetical protein